VNHVHSLNNPTDPVGPRPGHGLLNERQAAELLNVRVATLRRWRWAGKGPAFLKIGGAVRYNLAELDRFVAAARRTSTSDPGTAGSNREAA
jgi:Helix-turn-helix domain